MWSVYLLLCADGSLYTGISLDPLKRFLTHQQGRGAKYTRIHKPIKIVFRQEFATKSEALKREFEIKSWTREKKITALKLSSLDPLV